MKIDESNIYHGTTVLVEFRGKQMFTSGYITLPIYIGGVHLHVTFVVLDSLTSYNLIPGRPWINEMRAVLFTFHQVIRFPTRWESKILRVNKAFHVTTIAIP